MSVYMCLEGRSFTIDIDDVVIVWIQVSLNGLCSKDSLTREIVLEVSGAFRMWGNGRSLAHWGHALEGDYENLAPSSSLLLPSHMMSGLIHSH